MKKIILSIIVAAATLSGQAQKSESHGYPYDPVPFTSVKVTDAFWGQRLQASREVTIPLAFSKCEETGRYENFVKAANPSDDYVVGGYSFDDTDVYVNISIIERVSAYHIIITWIGSFYKVFVTSSLFTFTECKRDGYFTACLETLSPESICYFYRCKWYRVVRIPM